MLRKLPQKVYPKPLAFIGEGFLFEPRKFSFLEFVLLYSCTQPFGSLIVYRGNLPKKYENEMDGGC
jgi:hypothetical protein